jgi:hypothetical protein
MYLYSSIREYLAYNSFHLILDDVRGSEVECYKMTKAECMDILGLVDIRFKQKAPTSHG